MMRGMKYGHLELLSTRERMLRIAGITLLAIVATCLMLAAQALI